MFIFNIDVSYNFHLFTSILDQEIKPDQLNSLTEEDLKILIPNIGPCRKFQKYVKEYLHTEVFILHLLLYFLVK